MEETVPEGKTKFTAGDSTFIIDNRYEFLKYMGRNAWGFAISAMDHKINTRVLIHKISREDSLNKAKNILREIKLLNFFDHEDIIKLYNIELYPDTRNYNEIYMVTDFMEADLSQLIYSEVELTNEHVQCIMYQLLRGVLYMHSADIFNLDLNPHNVWLDSSCDLKICGLKLAKDCRKVVKIDEWICPIWYRSPELILGCPALTKNVDIWSCGCIFAELLGRSPLFPSSDSVDILQRITQLLGSIAPDDIFFITNTAAEAYIANLPDQQKASWSSLYPNADPLALDLLDKMIVINPEKRWAASHCLEHPYFKDLHDIEDEPLAGESFNWDFENCELSIDSVKNLVYEEASKFHH
ncbi:unnamed protein product [Blepharisma stoltei]|uniref:Protein kinase domain-containing protein n=1 Tax=Blepharisma stoltei TaxID=1481888 RepID=A0AAU9K560_9CILI|nr:unnamed protein product [Blepharisma stoltei]